MKHIVETTWKGNMKFESDLDGHKVLMDALPENGGEDLGARPKKLMLAALAGCTGMDVVSLLKKMRVEFDDLEIVVEGDVTEEHPKHYDGMHIIYKIIGGNPDPEKVKKAIDMSQEKYCGVSAAYRKAMDVTYEIKIINK